MESVEESEKLQILAEDFYEFSLESSPSYAIVKGDHRFNSELEDYSQEALEKKETKISQFIKLLQSLNSEDLNSKDLITYGMLEFTLNNAEQILLDRTFEFDAGVAGWQSHLLDYHSMFYLPNEESANNLHRRIEKYKDLYEQISLLQKKPEASVIFCWNLLYWSNGETCSQPARTLEYPVLVSKAPVLSGTKIYM